MGHEISIGKNTLGAGNKMKTHLHGYERSTHNIGYVWRSTMASGTLVPFMQEVGTPGTTFDIDLNAEVLTHPTVGPLFGSYKLQLDVFQIPIRLYNAKLHMNTLKVGMEMEQIKFPQLKLTAGALDLRKGSPDNQQINPSCILKYLGIAGVGKQFEMAQQTCVRQFNGLGLLMYWDIYLNYYANKQEEIGYVIHHDRTTVQEEIYETRFFESESDALLLVIPEEPTDLPTQIIGPQARYDIIFDALDMEHFNEDRITLYTREGLEIPLPDMWETFEWFTDGSYYFLRCRNPKAPWNINQNIHFTNYSIDRGARNGEILEPKLYQFDLQKINDMKLHILTWQAATPLIIDRSSLEPYNLVMDFYTDEFDNLDWNAAAQNQEGLGIKTYQSDLFNNWVSTEWIDGDNGVNAISSVDVSGGTLTMDALNLAGKVYNLLNRITMSGGTYEDWQRAVWDHQGIIKAETPIYMGGLSKELIFQEVIATTALPDEQQPLGQLGGRGKLSGKHKGGKIRIRIDEPSYIMGIVSLTPRIDYSQGNSWMVNLKTMDDLHKPQMDEIGFQDLITDKMAFWDTKAGTSTTGPLEPFSSAGKQPAWIDYMTNVNRVYGNFADENQQMFMVLNRRYETSDTLDARDVTIKDLTTYIDPAKYNYIFAYTKRDAQNFWVQIGVDMTRRAKMSAKLIPNL